MQLERRSGTESTTTVHVCHTAQCQILPYHTGSGKRAQRVWTRSSVALVSSAGHGAAVWCGQSSVLNIQAEQRHSSRTEVGPVGRLLRRPASHCCSWGLLIPATPSATVEPAWRLTGEFYSYVVGLTSVLNWGQFSSLTAVFVCRKGGMTKHCRSFFRYSMLEATDLICHTTLRSASTCWSSMAPLTPVLAISLPKELRSTQVSTEQLSVFGSVVLK